MRIGYFRCDEIPAIQKSSRSCDYGVIEIQSTCGERILIIYEEVRVNHGAVIRSMNGESFDYTTDIFCDPARVISGII